MMILNSEELDTWLFQKCQVEGKRCEGVKDFVNGELANVAWKCEDGEVFQIQYLTESY